MEARVSDDCRWSTITALGGMEFTRSEWRVVPFGREAEAKRNPHLTLREPMDDEVLVLDDEPDTPALDELSMAQLRGIARSAGVEKMPRSKAALIAAIEDVT